MQLSPLKAFRIIFKNISSEVEYWNQAFGVLKKIYLQKYRLKILLGVYVFTLVTFWILSGVRAAATKSEDSGLLATLIFHLMWITSAIQTYILIKRCNAEDDLPPDQESLPDFILRVFNAKKFEEIETNRKNYCFDCMNVNHKRQELRINHCSNTEWQQCTTNFQKYSKLFGKSIGNSSFRIYFCNTFCSLILSFLWVRQSIWAMYGSLKAESKDTESWLFFWLEAQLQLWYHSIIFSLVQAVYFKLMIFFFEEVLYMLFAISRNMTLSELKLISTVVYKQNKFPGYGAPNQEEEIAGAEDDEGPDLFGQPRDHLYKVNEQRIDGESSSSEDEYDGSAGQS